MDAQQHLEHIQQQMESGEYFRSKEMMQITCECGKKFFLNVDELGTEKLCVPCRSFKRLLPNQKMTKKG